MRINILLPALSAMVALCLPMTPAIAAQPGDPDRNRPEMSARDHAFAADFQRFLKLAMKRFPSVPALSVAVVHDGKPVVLDALGMADRSRHEPATPAARFYIASSTKAFVGTAMALLAERGTIDLDWTLAQMAPDIYFAPGVQADKVTLRDLLDHTHGLIDDGLSFRVAYSGQYDQATLWHLLGEARPNPKAPLGTYRYSNLGYNIATLLVERKLGRRWQDIVDTEILQPLAMRETSTQGLARARAEHVFAQPYDGMTPLYLIKHDRTMQSAGGMYSSANDLARWLALQMTDTGELARAAAEARRPAASLDATFGPFQRNGYGLGWYSGGYDGVPLYHAFGAFVGARAHVSVMPSQRLGVAAMTNDDGAGFFLVDIAAVYAYDWYLKGPDAAADHSTVMLDDLAKRYAAHERHVAEERGERAKRKPTLTLPASAYAGRYCNADFGEITVVAKDGGLHFSMGQLHAIATPGTQPDQLRVALIPDNATAAQFAIQKGHTAKLEAFDQSFARCGKERAPD